MRIESDKIERVVVRGTNWIGDAVMTVPALRALRRLLPHAHITLAIREWARAIFTNADFLDDILISETSHGALGNLNRLRHEIALWRERNFDLAVLLPNSFDAALVPFAARVPMRSGFATAHRARLLTNPIPVPAWRGERHEVFYYLEIVAQLEDSLTGKVDFAAREPEFDLRVSDARRIHVVEILRARGVNFARPVVAICPGSTNSLAKRWGTERFAALADRLIEQADAEVVLIGAKQEMDVTEQVVSAMRHQPKILTGELTLAETIAALDLCAVLISNDTGPAHIAAALGTKIIAIFGPTNPLTTRPFGAHAHVVRQPPACAPCMLRVCPIDHRCMTAITVEEVFAQTVLLLNEASTIENAHVLT